MLGEKPSHYWKQTDLVHDVIDAGNTSRKAGFLDRHGDHEESRWGKISVNSIQIEMITGRKFHFCVKTLRKFQEFISVMVSFY